MSRTAVAAASAPAVPRNAARFSLVSADALITSAAHCVCVAAGAEAGGGFENKKWSRERDLLSASKITFMAIDSTAKGNAPLLREGRAVAAEDRALPLAVLSSNG